VKDVDKFKTYVVTKLATDPAFAEKHSQVDAQGNKTVTFTPEMFAAVETEEVTANLCSCNFITGSGDGGGARHHIHCSDKEGSAT